MYKQLLPVMAIVGAVLSTAVALSPVAADTADTLGKAMDVAGQTNAAAASSQDRIDKLSDKSRRMLAEYRNAIRKTQQLKEHHRPLAGIVDAQEQREARLKQRLSGIGGLDEHSQPSMLRTLGTLKRFVKADLPFKRAERMEKLSRLNKAMADAGLSLAEKFHK